jgi:hypothetical protein
MKLTKKEEHELDLAIEQFPIVKRVLKELSEYEGEDSVKKFHGQLSKLMSVLADDMKLVISGDKQSGTILNNKTDEKIFERINIIVDKAAKYYEAIEKGNKMIDPDYVSKNTVASNEGSSIPVYSKKS